MPIDISRLQDRVDLEPENLELIQSLLPYMIRHALFWPCYFFTKSPLEWLSVTFFSRYGNPDTKHLGTRGIQNFWTDITRGRNRYHDCQAKRIYAEVDRQSAVYAEMADLVEVGEPIYAEILYGKHKGQYLLFVTYAIEPDNFDDERPITRFDLDRCKRLTESEFNNMIKKIAPGRADKLTMTTIRLT